MNFTFGSGVNKCKVRGFVKIGLLEFRNLHLMSNVQPERHGDNDTWMDVKLACDTFDTFDPLWWL